MYQLRTYQQTIVDRNLDALRRGVPSTLSGVFTGAGKTVIFCSMADQIQGRTLIIAPMRELVWQAVGKVREITSEDPDIEMADYQAERDAWPAKVVVASKQTLLSKRGGEYRYLRLAGFELVIIDEAHMQGSEQVHEMLRHFVSMGAMVAGFSATPFRMDGKPMMSSDGGFYQESICNYDLRWAIDQGWAVPPVCKLCRVETMDLSGISMSGGDYNQTALSAEIEKEATLQRICIITVREKSGQTIVFTPSVASAKGVAYFLTHNYGVPSVYVYGTMPPEERAEALRLFKSGEVQVLVNCQVVAVGFDYPPTATLILARPTRSRTFWLQAVGRATRPLSGVVDFPGSTPETRRAAIAASAKPHFKIVDCTDCSLDHRLVTSVDMFLSAPAEVKSAVKGAAAAAVDPLTTAELELMAAEEMERVRMAKLIEDRRRGMVGSATGTVSDREIVLDGEGKRSVGTYTNPLRGKYGGMRMSELPDHYIRWGSENTKLSSWIRTTFKKEIGRRNGQTGRFVSR